MFHINDIDMKYFIYTNQHKLPTTTDIDSDTMLFSELSNKFLSLEKKTLRFF